MQRRETQKRQTQRTGNSLLRTARVLKGSIVGSLLAGTMAFSSAQALDFSVHPNDTPRLNAISAKGLFEEGDADRLYQYVQALPEKPNTIIYFSSPGGSILEGIYIGDLVYQLRIKTGIAAKGECASACALAFLGGVDKRGRKWMSSTTTSRFGFNDAFNTPDAMSGLTQIVPREEVLDEIFAYAEDVKAPLSILSSALNADPTTTKQRWFSTRELCNHGIKVWSIRRGKWHCG